ncbi:battenin CLN3 protein [Tilletia horrida]|nr:battenin CLN3 protein [Tilletia horrida]
MDPSSSSAHYQNVPPSSAPATRSTSARSLTTFRFGLAFFLFGTLNNISYVIILTAALELMPKGVPTGVVAFANIFPALCAKAIFPYFLKGEVKYRLRIWSCSILTFAGMMVRIYQIWQASAGMTRLTFLLSLLPSSFSDTTQTIAWFESAFLRLVGISIASFCSGLGELTYLQLATRYSGSARSVRAKGAGGNAAGEGVGWFASGTGAAGFLGASAWWAVRPLGVKGGLSLCSLLPWLMALSFFVILPSPEVVLANADQQSQAEYAALATAEEEAEDEEDEREASTRLETGQEGDEDGSQSPRKPLNVSKDDVDLAAPSAVAGFGLAFSEKMDLLRPMLFVFVLPLAIVYLAEYTINQGVAPTLIYPLPTSQTHPLLAHFIKKFSDYYPLYQLCYQTFVFISRSSISVLRLPAIPQRFLWLPAIVQCTLFLVLTSESLYAWFGESIASPLTILLISLEGLAGGSAYVSVFHQVAMSDPARRIRLPTDQEELDPDHQSEPSEADATGPRDGIAADDELEHIRRVQQQEFRIACIGVADTLGICLASLISMPIQVGLCNAQVRSGRGLCKEV